MSVDFCVVLVWFLCQWAIVIDLYTFCCYYIVFSHLVYIGHQGLPLLHLTIYNLMRPPLPEKFYVNIAIRHNLIPSS